MKYAADFRLIARNALRGKWPIAILTGFVASLIGAGIASGGGGTYSSSGEADAEALFRQLQYSEIGRAILVGLAVSAVFVVILAIVMLIIGGAGKLGYAIFNLKLVDGRQPVFRDLFSQFHRLGDGFCMNLLIGLYTVLWSLLFIIPGIIKSFSYAMTPYILAEHPELTPNEAITESRRIMHGNKWRLFCLQISFIGWALLCAVPVLLAIIPLSILVVTVGPSIGAAATVLLLLPICALLALVGSLFLMPYQEAANAAFYREISGTWPRPEEPAAPEYGSWSQI